MSDDARDALEQDMANHESGRGREVRALENQSLAAQVLEQLDRQKAESKPVTAAPVAVPSFAGEREGKHGVYVVGESKSDDTRMRPSTEAERWFYAHAMPRINRLLEARETGALGSASWRDRLLAVLELSSRAASYRAANLDPTDLERRYMFELVELLNASDAVFRPSWKADVDDHRIQVQVR